MKELLTVLLLVILFFVCSWFVCPHIRQATAVIRCVFKKSLNEKKKNTGTHDKGRKNKGDW